MPLVRFIVGMALCMGIATAKQVATMNQAELEQRLDAINSRLEKLANLTLSSGAGSIGYRFYIEQAEGETVWLEVDLEQEFVIDEIVLTPVIWRDMKQGFLADGFPKAFRIINEHGEVLTEITADSGHIQHIAPLILPINGKTASRIRIEVVQASPRAFDQKLVFQLSEFMVFTGETNAALHKPVTANEKRIPEGGIGWDKRFVTDGSTPYFMNSGQGEQSVAFISKFNSESSSPTSHDTPLQLIIDLQRSAPISRIHIHAIEQGDTVPQAAPDNIGTPTHLLIEGSNTPDFADCRPLLELKSESIYDRPPIMMWNIPTTECRYVRLTALEPYIYKKNDQAGPRIGFAEIELYANDVNIAAHKPISSPSMKSYGARNLHALTDQRNIYGDLIPIREWLYQLAERQQLEHERPQILTELNERYARYQRNLHRMFWVTGLLLAVIIIAILINRNFRQRAIYQTRERIAADLHDELGANLHAISMLGGLVQKSKDSPERLNKLIQSMQAITERTGNAAHYFVNMLEDKERFADLAKNIRRTADRLAADLEHDLCIKGESILATISERKRIDLFLFYKECLANIIRHSGATQLTTRLLATPTQLQLHVHDNGTGLNGTIPSSLKRRAKLLRAQLTCLPNQPTGTTITLTLNLKRRWRFIHR